MTEATFLPSKTVMERTVAALVLVVAFLVCASIFAPGSSKADSHDVHSSGHHGDDDSSTHSAGHSDHSTDAHDGLATLGSLEGSRYRVEIFATDAGPRYTVHDTARDQQIAELITAQQMDEWFPDVPLPSVANGKSTSHPGALMYHESTQPNP